jgi:uroporphyrinogen-III decarboxylase
MANGSAGGEIYKPALDDWRKLKTLRLPDFDDPRRYSHVKSAFDEFPDKFRLANMPGWVFATSRYLRKMEVYFIDLIEYREEIDRLHEMVTDLYLKVIRLYAQSGAEGIFFCEDLGVQDRTLISPAMWRDVFRPHYMRLTGAAHECGMKVFMHSCGYNWDLIDDLVTAGIDCLQFDQPAVYDMPALAAKFRKLKVALFSPVDIQKVMPTGNRSLIESEAGRMVNTFRGFLIARNYGDLPGIGVKPEWDMWAYKAILSASGITDEMERRLIAANAPAA